MIEHIISKVGAAGKSSVALLALIFAAPHFALAAGGDLSGRVLEKRLSNGMKLLALPRSGAPVVTLEMTFRAGSADEKEGFTGVAHLLEHMLFKGTQKLGTSDWEKERPILEEVERVGKKLDLELKKGAKGSGEEALRLRGELDALIASQREFIVKDEIDAIYSRNGGTGFNAFTTTDLTSFIISLPSNRLELWAAIESDRMRTPIVREYYVERDVVKKER
ncbi:insulinase family protein, partial [bacterium]